MPNRLQEPDHSTVNRAHQIGSGAVFCVMWLYLRRSLAMLVCAVAVLSGSPQSAATTPVPPLPASLMPPEEPAWRHLYQDFRWPGWDWNPNWYEATGDADAFYPRRPKVLGYLTVPPPANRSLRYVSDRRPGVGTGRGVLVAASGRTMYVFNPTTRRLLGQWVFPYWCPDERPPLAQRTCPRFAGMDDGYWTSQIYVDPTTYSVAVIDFIHNLNPVYFAELGVGVKVFSLDRVRETARYKPREGHAGWEPPLIQDGHLILYSKNPDSPPGPGDQLIALDILTGQESWRRSLRPVWQVPQFSPQAAPGQVFWAKGEYAVLFDLRTGRLLWQRGATGGILWQNGVLTHRDVGQDRSTYVDVFVDEHGRARDLYARRYGDEELEAEALVAGRYRAGLYRQRTGVGLLHLDDVFGGPRRTVRLPGSVTRPRLLGFRNGVLIVDFSRGWGSRLRLTFVSLDGGVVSTLDPGLGPPPNETGGGSKPWFVLAGGRYVFVATYDDPRIAVIGDDELPAVRLLGLEVRQGAADITFRVFDARSDVWRGVVRVADRAGSRIVPAARGPDGIWRARLPLAPGPATVQVGAVDTSGNVGWAVPAKIAVPP